jgi:RNA polymerase sigma-70 factor, ECF subfamily
MAQTFPRQPAKAGSRGEWPQCANGCIVRVSFCALGSTLPTHDQDLETADTPAQGTDERDGSLLARMASGDLGAFSVLVDRHQDMVLAVAGRMLSGSSEAADDIAQEALLRLWRSAGQIELGEHSAGPWLRRVVSNLCVDRLRTLGRLAPMDENVPEPFEAARQLADIEQREQAANVEAAIRALPDRQRVALSLFHYEDLSLADIAGRLDLSVDAVESLLARARRSLRKALEAEWRALVEDAS